MPRRSVGALPLCCQIEFQAALVAVFPSRPSVVLTLPLPAGPSLSLAVASFLPTSVMAIYNRCLDSRSRDEIPAASSMNPVRSLHLQPSVTTSVVLWRSTIPAISCSFDVSPVRRFASCRNVSQSSYSTKVSRIASRTRSGLNVACIQPFFGSGIRHGIGCSVSKAPKSENPRLVESWDTSPKQPSPKCCSIPSLRRVLGIWNGTVGWDWEDRPDKRNRDFSRTEPAKALD
jgi:hypothetical protein